MVGGFGVIRSGLVLTLLSCWVWGYRWRVGGECGGLIVFSAGVFWCGAFHAVGIVRLVVGDLVLGWL